MIPAKADNHGNQPPAEHIGWFLTFAFGNRIALTVDSVNIEATDASALPTHSRSSWGPHNVHVMYKLIYTSSASACGICVQNRTMNIRFA